MQIDFYILDISGRQQALRFACQLLEKVSDTAEKIYVHTDSSQEAQQIDELMWIYRDDSFLPHQLYSENDETPPAIQIGHGDIPASQQNILLNLSKQVPANFQQFQHIIEIVFADPSMQQFGRDRYRYYRDQGHDINTHKLKANEL